MCILANLTIGIVSSVIASAITLSVDRRIIYQRQRRRARAIEGAYSVVDSNPHTDTSRETVTIKYLASHRFRIESKGGPISPWDGTFTSSDDSPEYGIGTYTHADNAWGVHEFQFNTVAGRISVYGTNKNMAGEIKPFSYVLIRKSTASASIT